MTITLYVSYSRNLKATCKASTSINIDIMDPPGVFSMHNKSTGYVGKVYVEFQLAFIVKKQNTASSVCLQGLWKMRDEFVLDLV